MTTPETLLIFRIAGIACAVPAESVGSIVMPPEHLTHPPGSGRSTPGIFHHADSTYSVIDLPARFGIDTPRRGAGRLLLHSEGIRHFAFLVDEVVGLFRSEEGKWASLPPYLPHSVFWSGFLFRKEIVLCTELGALRNMHDAAPLHRHIEAMRQQARETPSTKTTAKEPLRAAVDKQPKPHLTEPPKPADKPAPAPRSAKTADKTAEKPTAAAPPRTPPPVPERKPPPPLRAGADAAAPPKHEVKSPHTPTPKPPQSGAKPIPRPSRQETRPPADKPVATTPAASTIAKEAESVTPPPSSPATQEPSGFPLLPLLLLLLMLALPLGYWFWLKPAPPQPAPPITIASTPSVVAPPVEEEAVAPEPPAAPEKVTAAETTAEPAPAPVTAPAPAEETKPAAPLTISRDSEGTINLIIDREAIIASTEVPPLTLHQPGGSSRAEETERKPPPTDDAEPGTQADTAATDAAQPKTEQEPPLEPEPDWPQPANPTGLEPCDCTHIVVPGDTLWDIAERYTGNAFNYPELARRSGITNPDLIYPGDTVRIIIR